MLCRIIGVLDSLSHTAQILRPLHNVARKRNQFVWGGGGNEKRAFKPTKHAVPYAVALGPKQSHKPFELEILVSGDDIASTLELVVKR